MAYVEGERAPSITEWAGCRPPGLRPGGHEATGGGFAEPGRSIVASAAVTLYTVGTIKDLPGIRTYVSVDGGGSDNPGRGSAAAATRRSWPDR